MERWQDQGIVLSARAHGENGAVVSLLTENHGRFAGYVRGAHSSKGRGTLEAGNIVDVDWQSRVADQLGSFSLELSKNPTAHFIAEPLKLGALQSACALCDVALPEREGHPGLFYGLGSLFEALASDVWAPAYVMWEIAFLKELGFSLDLRKCASGQGDPDLIYVSPKTGRAVSRSAGQIYKERLLALPGFLSPNGGSGDDEEVYAGLRLTAYFLEHWVFAHSTKGIPEARLRFETRFAKTVSQMNLEAASQ
jgi:DNA repair protein RecO (recombination protein O)